MGWKNVKEAYKIGHNVCVTDEGICIGSGYIHNIITIGMDGKIKRRDVGYNDDLRRYLVEMDADPVNLRQLIESKDTFEKSITVYTYNEDPCNQDGGIIEKQCEELGWPNVTHDGKMMYENTFSVDRQTVVRWAKHNADLWIKSLKQNIADLGKSIAEHEATLLKVTANREALELDVPAEPKNTPSSH